MVTGHSPSGNGSIMMEAMLSWRNGWFVLLGNQCWSEIALKFFQTQLFPVFCMIYPVGVLWNQRHFHDSASMGTCQMRALLKIASNEFEMRSPAMGVHGEWSQVTFELHQAKVFWIGLRSSFLQVPCNYAALYWLQTARDSATVPPTLSNIGFSRSSVKGHKSSVKEGNALYLDGLQYSNKAGWLDPWDPWDPWDPHFPGTVWELKWSWKFSWGDWRAQEVDSELHEGRKRQSLKSWRA